jgi:hypothetical protein
MSQPSRTLAGVDNITSDLVNLLLRNLATRFSHPHWDGPFIATPEEAVQMHAGRPRWELWVQQSAPNSRNSEVKSGGVRAAIAFDTVAELLDTPLENHAYRLTLAIAGQAAHEALEWVRLDGDLVIDPHGDLEDAGEGIVSYLESSGW